MTIDVEQGSWDRIENPGYPEDISTGGMGPCVGIFIYNVASKVTYAGHFIAPHTHCSDNVEKMIDGAMNEFQGSEEITIYISGAVLGECESQDKRAFVKKLLTERCGQNSNLCFRWPKPGVDSVEMVLNPNDGLFEVSER